MFNITKYISKLFIHKEKFSLEERRELANAQREAFTEVVNNPEYYLYKKSRDKSDFEKVVDNIDWLDSFLADNGVISEIDSLWPNIAERKKQIKKINRKLISTLKSQENHKIGLINRSKSHILEYSIRNNLKSVVGTIKEQNELLCEILEDPTLCLLDEVFLSVKENSLPIVKKISFR